jgi:hypothetical protein
MELEHVRYGQRIRVHAPDIADHGQVGTIKQVRGHHCFVHLDRDERPERLTLFHAAELEPAPNEPLPRVAHHTRRSI